jgi:DNA-binding HxlR family transcriptional regulator
MTTSLFDGLLGNPYDRNCPTRRILDRIGDRWTVLIVGSLSQGPLRFGEISRRVDGISQKMLTQTLRALERDGIVERTVFAELPPRVEYTLTPVGETLCVPLRALELWAIENLPTVEESRKDYDSIAS